MMEDKINRLSRAVDALAPEGELIIHVRDPRSGRGRIVRKPWGGPRDVNIDLDEQDLKL
jgi:hypothetical protein